jgi:DNA-binding transcriptional regulator YiaG
MHKMVKKLSELRQAMIPQAHAQAEQQTQSMLAEMPLHELRRARGLSQKVLAQTLHVQQPSVAKM